MIRKFIFGNPIETEALVDSQSIQGMSVENPGQGIPHFTARLAGEESSWELALDMGERDIIYGLGEQAGLDL